MRILEAKTCLNSIVILGVEKITFVYGAISASPLLGKEKTYCGKMRISGKNIIQYTLGCPLGALKSSSPKNNGYWDDTRRSI